MFDFLSKPSSSWLPLENRMVLEDPARLSYKSLVAMGRALRGGYLNEHDREQIFVILFAWRHRFECWDHQVRNMEAQCLYMRFILEISELLCRARVRVFLADPLSFAIERDNVESVFQLAHFWAERVQDFNGHPELRGQGIGCLLPVFEKELQRVDALGLEQITETSALVAFFDGLDLACPSEWFLQMVGSIDRDRALATGVWWAGRLYSRFNPTGIKISELVREWGRDIIT